MSLIKIDRTNPLELGPICQDACTTDYSFFKIIMGKVTYRDERVLNITEIDIDSIKLVSPLKEGEKYLEGGSKTLNRLEETGHILFDARICEALYANVIKFPTSWTEQVEVGKRSMDASVVNGKAHLKIFFFGSYFQKGFSLGKSILALTFCCRSKKWCCISTGIDHCFGAECRIPVLS